MMQAPGEAAIATQPMVEIDDRPTGYGYHLIHSSERNYDAMVNWYQTLFGVEAVGVAEDVPAKDLLDQQRDLIIIEKKAGLEPLRAPFKPGFLHTAWFYNSLAELIYVVRRARDLGIVISEVSATSVFMQIYIPDPDGNIVELGVDRYDTSEETQAAARTAADTRTPESMKLSNYNIDTVIRMMEAGVPDHDIFDNHKYHALAATGQY